MGAGKSKAPQSDAAEGTVGSSTVDQTDSSFNQNTVHMSLLASPQACPQSGPQAYPQTSLLTCPQCGPTDRASLCELLGVSRSECSRGSAQVSEETLIQESVHIHLPEPPKELDTDPQRHLLAVQTVMQSELIRLAPQLKPHGLMGVLTQSYHCAVFRQMKELLQQTGSSNTSSSNTSSSNTSSSNTSSSNTSSSRTSSSRTSSSRTNPSWTCLQLLQWAQYLSQELFLHPDLQTLNLLQYLDPILLSDWTQDAQDKLLTLLQTDVSSQLNKILGREREHKPCLKEEKYVSAYVDVIQCIDALPKEAFKFSPELSRKLTQVCFKELLLFVQSYKTQWFQWLKMLKKKMADREMLQFFRTLKICKELKKYISETRLKWTEVSDITEKIETLLEETEAFTLTILLDTVAVFTESGLKEYFRSNHRNRFLMTHLERLFSPESWSWMSLEEHKSTMDRCYRLIVSLYSKHLRSRRLSKLEKSWSPDVANSVSEDAWLIHKIMTNLCPQVEEWNFTLHSISDLLKTEDLDVIKITAGEMLHKCNENRLTEDAALLPALLRWKGLSKRKIKEVLDPLEDLRKVKSAPHSVLDRILHWIKNALSHDRTERNMV